MSEAITVDPAGTMIVPPAEAPPFSSRDLSDEERRRILVEWNRTDRAYPRGKTIHELFEEQVGRAPEAVAVVFEGKSLAYRELDARANRVAGHLRAMGVGPGVIVGLGIERSFEMVVAILGILKAGGAYWAMEANLPAERARLMLAEALPRVALARRNSAALAVFADNSAEPRSRKVVAIEDLLEAEPAENNSAARPATALDPAYISYTSGSSGRPKGVVVPHRGVARLVIGANYVSFTPGEVLLHLAPLSFDASTFELWGALLNGGSVVLMAPGPPTPAEIGETIRRNGVTTVLLTTGLFCLMVDERLDDLRQLRQLLAGGDALSPRHAAKARRGLTGCRVVNGYGPTENTTFTTCYSVGDEGELAPTVPIGRPISNTKVYVLDPELRPVPVGVPGELFAGGDGLALGYLGQPELTAERFVPDPFSDSPDGRLYRTGDRVRWRANGDLEFLGRLDSQVKIRGFRIELEEIEAVLRADPEIRAATVVARADPRGEKQLDAYLVAETVERPAASAVRARLADKLPGYMIPRSFMWLDQMPLTPNGKADRKSLAALAPGGGDAGVAAAEHDPPVSIVELELARVWRRLLHREEIGRHDNFFALGGHSLLAACLAAEIEKIWGHDLPVATLFQSPTLESLARRITEEGWAPPWSSLVPLRPFGSKPPLFFFHGVGGSIFCLLPLARRLEAGQPSFGLHAVGLDGMSALHDSLDEMVAHYVREIRAFQPGGPYYLCGYSLGGVIAFEAAQLLRRQGQKVGLVALLDSEVVGPIPWSFYLRTPLAISLRHFQFRLARWRFGPEGEPVSLFRALRRAAARLLFGDRRDRTGPVENRLFPRVPALDDHFTRLVLTRRPRSYPGRLEVFESDHPHPDQYFWDLLALEGVARHRVGGCHDGFILSPERVAALAEALTAVLRRVQAEDRPARERP
jgi:amino acid adenylation domain-containing protein